jgi:hypothetical protein
MKIYDFLPQAEQMARLADWAGIEEVGRSLAQSLIPPDRIEAISSVDLRGYERDLASMLKEAEGRSTEFQGVQALYWEFDLDNNWDCSISFCSSYTPNDPDWAGDQLGWIRGPGLPEFARLYAEHGFSDTPAAEGSTLLLVARTLATFGRAYDLIGRSQFPVGAAFHDSSVMVMMPRA